jgi:hypothetical protein
MRIVITELGDEILKKFSEEEKTKRIKDEENKKQENINNLKAIAKANGEKMNVSGFECLKEIKIKYAKNPPKVITEKYNSTDSKGLTLLPQLNITRKRAESSNFLAQGDSTEDHWTARLNFQIRDVVGEKSLSKLRTKIQSDRRMRDKLSRVDEKCFRSTYQDKSDLQRLEEKLDKEITPDKINLIKYLNQKEALSEVLLNKLTTFDDEKSNKLNKICQIVFHKQNDELIFQNTLKKALVVNKNREKVEYKTRIETLGNNVKNLGEVLKKYPKQGGFNREKYKDIHNDMVKTWKRFHSDKLQRTQWKFVETGNTEVTGNISKIINASDIY